MKCRQCGTEFEGRFCPECGTKAETQTAQPATPPQTGLAGAALFMKRHIAEVSNKRILAVAFALSCVLAILFLIFFDTGDDSAAEAPKAAETELGRLTWSTGEMASLIPTPGSKVGDIIQDDKEAYIVYVGDTSIDEYNMYVDACAEKGFTVNISKTSKSYSAKNADAYRLIVDYQDNDVMYISVLEPAFDVSIEIQCENNPELGKYDVDVSVDNILQGKIAYGTTEIYDLTLTKGKHIIRFTEADNTDTVGDTTFSVSGAEELTFKILCAGSAITVTALSSDDTTPTPEATGTPTEIPTEAPTEAPTAEAETAESKTITMYAADGRTIEVSEAEAEANKAVGWYSTEAEAQAANKAAQQSSSSASSSASSSVNNNTSAGSGTVYRTPSGKKYHLDPDCGGKNSYAITMEQAESSGLEPCKKCAQ